MRLYLFMMGVCFTLVSCVSPKMSQEVQFGKSLFAAGEYKRSFSTLLPAAACGNVQAQYAVGYMYYYGFGTSQDSESGLFWMRQAAAKNYLPAIKALQIIARGPESEGPCKGSICPGIIYKGESNSLVSEESVVRVPRLKKTYRSYLKDVHPAVSVKPPVISEVKKPVSVVKSTSSRQQKEPAKIKLSQVKKTSLKVPPKLSDQFALQLFGAYALEDVKKLQEELELKNTHIWYTQHKGRDWFVLTYGNFSTPSAAKVEKQKLMAEVDIEPWIRKLEGLNQVG